MERRRRFRIPLRSGHPLRATIAVANRRPRVVDVVNVGPGGMLIEFPYLAPVLGVGTRVRVELRLGRVVATLPAVTRHQNGGRYGLRFERDSQTLWKIVDALEAQWLARRKAM